MVCLHGDLHQTAFAVAIDNDSKIIYLFVWIAIIIGVCHVTNHTLPYVFVIWNILWGPKSPLSLAAIFDGLTNLPLGNRSKYSKSWSTHKYLYVNVWVK